jgi:transcriptional regulator with XRE-family HTH domain
VRVAHKNGEALLCHQLVWAISNFLVNQEEQSAAFKLSYVGKQMGQKSTSDVDSVIGARTRSRRLQLGMSQERLAELLGITFQQVQKYEKGANRISASRLVQIAKALGIEVAYFFDGLSEAEASVESLLSTKDVVHLAQAFGQVKNQDVRRAILELVRVSAGES